MTMKKKEPINLRTDLNDTDININLRRWNCQSFTEIINKPKKDLFHRDSKRTSTQSCDLNWDKFSNNDFKLSESSPYNHTSSSNNNNESLRILMDDTYTNYIHSIKKMYPNFRFNHYSNYSEKIKLNSSMMSSNSDFRVFNVFESHISFGNDDYVQSMKLVNIGLGKDYLVSKEEFKLKEDLLEEKQMELYDSTRNFDSKVEAIEMELERVLTNSNILYNYIEKNMSLGKEIEQSINSLKSKKNSKADLNRKYILNSSQLMLKGIKRQNIKKSISQLKNLQELYQLMNNVHMITKSEAACNEISDAISESRSLIKRIDKQKRLKCVQQCDKEIQILESQSEHKLTGDLMNILKRLFMLSIQCDDINSKNIIDKKNSIKKRIQFDYKEDSQLEYNDYVYGNDNNNSNSNSDKLRIRLISKDEECKVFLYQLLESMTIIIKDNFDIEDFITLIETVLKEIIMKLFDMIQKEVASEFKDNDSDNDGDKMKLIEVLAKAFKMFYLNYEYVIYLFEQNFGWIKKIFVSLEKKVVEEMNKLMSFVISSMIHNEILSGDISLYLSTKKELIEISDEYYQFVKVDSSIAFKQLDLDFLLAYFENQRNYLLNCFEKETWIQMNEVNDIYYQMTKIIITDSTQLSLNSFTIHNIPNNNNGSNSNGSELISFTNGNDNNSNDKKINNQATKLHEYIIIKENKFRVIELTLEEISFMYSCLYLSYAFDKAYTPEIAKNVYSIIAFISNKAKEANKVKQITEKEIALLSSNIQVISYLSHSFSLATNTHKSDPFIILINTLNDINSECINGMIQLLNAVNASMIEDLNSLDFANYPTYEKDYNTYIKKFSKLKKLYDGMMYAFDNKEIIAVFNNQLLSTMNDMEKVIVSKCRIEVDNSLKQFRREMFYMKKVMKMFDLITTETLIEKIESFSKKVNPNKVFKKKKTKENGDI